MDTKDDKMDLTQPGAWWLITRDDVQAALDCLAFVCEGTNEPQTVTLCETALHILQTGVHETGAVPSDFQKMAD